MKVEFRKSFVRDLKSVSDKSLLKKIKEAIEKTEEISTLSDLTNCKKLKGEDDYFLQISSSKRHL